MFEESFDAVLKKQDEKLKERAQRIDRLYALRPFLRQRLNVSSSLNGSSDSVVAVDSAYKLRKDILRMADYAIVAVAVWFDSHEPLFYVPSSFMFFHEEDYVEQDYLLSALGAATEFKLLSKHSSFDWLLLDGSVFSFLLNIEIALNLTSRKFSQGRIFQLAKEALVDCAKDLDAILRSNSLIAVPKFSSRLEFKNRSRLSLDGLEEAYSDFELCQVLLSSKEYIEIPSYDNIEFAHQIIDKLASHDFLLSKEAVSVLENCRFFYIKGSNNVVYRVEFFSDRDFPAGLIHSQALLASSQLELVAQADSLARYYLNLLFSNKETLFGFYR